jgi:carboxymethylenebutenolidase
MNYFQRYLAEEFAEDYSEGRITRRKAMKLIASVTGSAVIANSILAACAPPPAGTPAGAVPSDIPVTGTQAASPTGMASRPAASTPAPAVVATATGTASATDIPSAGVPSAASPTVQVTGTPASAMANATVSPNDSAVTGSDVQFNGSDNATLFAYLARPAAGDAAPVVLVCHENRGLTEHIRDVARRLAKAGYVALAIDLLSRQGGTAKVGADNVPGALGSIDPNQFVQDFISGWNYLKGQPFVQAERVGMVGFCFGGGVTWQVATKMPELRAAVPYYGPPPPVEQLATVQAAVLAIYGEKDTRITSTAPAVEAAMKKYNKVFDKAIYAGADHAFNNDTGPRYNPQAASEAWARTLAWFGKYLRG